LEKRLCQRNWILKLWLHQHSRDAGQLLQIPCVHLQTNEVRCRDDTIFKPFIGPGLGRAKTPDHVSSRDLLMWLYRKIWQNRHQIFADEKRATACDLQTIKSADLIADLILQGL
jgi:hypothetical protein